MKQRWQDLAARFEALSERERIMSFVAALALLVFGVQAAVLGPMARKEEMLRARIRQQDQAIAGIQASIADQARLAAVDPDQPLRERLQGVEVESERLAGKLRSTERGVVAPERMAPLLEAMLRANGRLRMVALRTLPVTPLSAVLAEGKPQAAAGTSVAASAPTSAVAPAPALALAAAAAATASAENPAAAGKEGAPGTAQPPQPPQPPRPPPPELLYRHGVELTVRGGYLDLVDYMNTLESLPVQLFWGRAQLEVEHYPDVRLTLTLYTMSLDDQWMKL